MLDTGTWVWNPQPHIRLSIEIKGHTLNESMDSLDRPRKWWISEDSEEGTGWWSKECTALRRFAHFIQTGEWNRLTRDSWGVPEDVDALWDALRTLYWNHPNNK